MSDVRVLITEYDIENISDEWEALVSAGQTIAEAHDRNRWSLGDLGNKCERRYGEDSLGQYAAAINVRPTTMYDYSACSRFYSIEDRAAYPPLNWSHYRAAMQASDHSTALIWLAKAADEGWTVEQLNDALRVEKGKQPSPRKLLQLGGQYVDLRPVVDGQGVITGCDVVFRVVASANLAVDEALTLRQAYTVKVYGTGEEEADDTQA